MIDNPFQAGADSSIKKKCGLVSPLSVMCRQFDGGRVSARLAGGEIFLVGYSAKESLTNSASPAARATVARDRGQDDANPALVPGLPCDARPVPGARFFVNNVWLSPQ